MQAHLILLGLLFSALSFGSTDKERNELPQLSTVTLADVLNTSLKTRKHVEKVKAEKIQDAFKEFTGKLVQIEPFGEREITYMQKVYSELSRENQKHLISTLKKSIKEAKHAERAFSYIGGDLDRELKIVERKIFLLAKLTWNRTVISNFFNLADQLVPSLKKKLSYKLVSEEIRTRLNWVYEAHTENLEQAVDQWLIDFLHHPKGVEILSRLITQDYLRSHHKQVKTSFFPSRDAGPPFRDNEYFMRKQEKKLLAEKLAIKRVILSLVSTRTPKKIRNRLKKQLRNSFKKELQNLKGKSYAFPLTNSGIRFFIKTYLEKQFFNKICQEYLLKP